MAKNWMERLIQEDQKLEPKQSEPLPLRGDMKRKAVARIDAAVHAKLTALPKCNRRDR